MNSRSVSNQLIATRNALTRSAFTTTEQRTLRSSCAGRGRRERREPRRMGMYFLSFGIGLGRSLSRVSLAFFLRRLEMIWRVTRRERSIS